MAEITRQAPFGLSPKGEWFRHQSPYAHVRASGVFTDDAYRRIEGSFRTILQDTLAKTQGVPVLRPSTGNYDAWMLEVSRDLAASFAPFFEQSWLDFLAGVMGVPPCQFVDGALHHIPRNSRSGYVHTDFCSAWFDESTAGDIPRFPSRGLTEYFSGRKRQPNARPVEQIRIVTMIFYLANDDWKAGHGGETGLFPTAKAELGALTACPPVNNSLLLFECSPHSHHGLLGNPGCDRNSVILWLHASVDHATAKWGGAVNRRRP